jgi:hypothetical protein
MRRAATLATLVLLAGLPLTAQEAPPRVERAGAIGIGLTLNPAVLLAFDETDFLMVPGLNTFLVPIRVNPRLTLEPEFGLFRYSIETTGSSGSSSSDFSNLRIGVGALTSFRTRGGLTPYAGPRAGIVRNRTSNHFSGGGGAPSDYKTKRDDWYVSAVLGAQYHFSPHFSLGGGVQATRTSIGDEEESPPSGFPSPDTKFIIIGTSGLIMLRFFF